MFTPRPFFLSSPLLLPLLTKAPGAAVPAHVAIARLLSLLALPLLLPASPCGLARYFEPTRQYGLIGRNGVGKTTLLRHMASYDIEGFPRHHRVMHVRQEIKPSEKTVIQVREGREAMGRRTVRREGVGGGRLGAREGKGR